MVPRFPNSWSRRAGPTSTSLARFAPAPTPIFAMKGARQTRTIAPAAPDSFISKSLSRSGPKSPPMMVAKTMGKRVSVPMPMSNFTMPIISLRTARTSAPAYTFQYRSSLPLMDDSTSISSLKKNGPRNRGWA